LNIRTVKRYPDTSGSMLLKLKLKVDILKVEVLKVEVSKVGLMKVEMSGHELVIQ
jgi:hypothetical protein